MKKKTRNRIFVALAGLLLLAGLAAAVMELFTDVKAVHMAASFARRMLTTTYGEIGLYILLLAVLALSLWCILYLFRGEGKPKGFVTQRTASGKLDISLKSMKSLVNNCLDKHPELESRSLDVVAERDGVSVQLRASLPTGISIPMAVNDVQQEIREYLTNCSGLQVKEVWVQIDGLENKKAKEPYEVPLSAVIHHPVTETAPEAEAASEPEAGAEGKIEAEGKTGPEAEEVQKAEEKPEAEDEENKENKENEEDKAEEDKVEDKEEVVVEETPATEPGDHQPEE